MTNSTWAGNDSRFSHRKGGYDGGNGKWVDVFGIENQNEPVCRAAIRFESGKHRLTWAVEMYFAEPICQKPHIGYPAFLASASGVNVEYRQVWNSQVLVCASRQNLVYRGSLSMDFIARSPGDVVVAIAAFNDKKTYDPTSTGVREAVVNQLQIENMVNSASAATIVWPLGPKPD